MEYVAGIAMTDYCDRARLSIHERLQTFAQVCRAIQHAHGKGIIHRDIKASNAGVYSRQPEVEAAVRDTLDQFYMELGFARPAEEHFRRALGIREKILGEEAPDSLESMRRMGAFLTTLGRVSAVPTCGGLLAGSVAADHTVRPAVWNQRSHRQGRVADRSLLEEAERSQVSARFLLETLRMQRFVRRRIKHCDCPMLAFFAERDLVIDNRASIQILSKVRSGCALVEVLEPMSHILAAAMPKEELIGRIVGWLRDGWRAGERFRVVRTRMPKQDGQGTLKPYPGVSPVPGARS